MEITIKLDHKLIIILFFIALLITGLLIYDDYGLSYDESVQRDIGLRYYNYIFKGDRALMDDTNKIYGPAFELPLIIIEKVLRLTDTEAIYYMRHLMTFLLFYVSVIFFYLLIKDLFKDWRIGLLGCIILVLSPRIFANAFYNNKDLAFMSAFIISMYTLNKFLKKPDYQNAIIHGLITAILIDIRIVGIIIPSTTLLFIIPKIIKSKNVRIDTRISNYVLRTNFNKTLLNTFIYVITLIIFVIAFWPTLWEGPLHYFIQSIREMSQFPHWQGTVYYFGEFIKGTKIPWHYIPVWVFITTPIIYTLMFITGLLVKAKDTIKRKIKTNELIHPFLAISPVIIVILLNSVLYNGWRHLYFIYPSFIITGLFGVKALIKYKSRYRIQINNKKTSLKKIINYTLLIILSASFTNTLVSMIRLHPYQCVYFNPIFSSNMSQVKLNFPLDYWGLSFKEAHEYLLDNYPGKFNITSFNMDTKDFLPLNQRHRLNYTNNIFRADFLIHNYDHHPSEFTHKNEVFSIKVGGAKIISVFNLTDKRQLAIDLNQQSLIGLI